MRKPSIRTFVSYSRQDSGIVEPIVALLKITRNDVFWDVQSIPLGTRWREEIEAALGQAEIIVVFWCRHSEQSTEVEKEWQTGHALGKRILPVILDETKLPWSLGDYQFVDFRPIVSAGLHSSESQGEKKQGTSMNANIGPILLFAALATTLASFWDRVVRFAQGDYNALLYYAPGPVWLAGGVALIVFAVWSVLRIREERKKRSERLQGDITRMADMLYSEVRASSRLL